MGANQMILADAAISQGQPVMREEEVQSLRVEPSYYLRPTAQGVEVVKIPPQWTWQIEPVKRVLECLALKNNWNSYGGKISSLHTAIAVIDFIDWLPANFSLTPRVVPLSTGGIQLEMSRAGKTLEIEFTPEGRIDYLQSEGDVDREGVAVLSQELITYWMTWLTAA